MRAINHDVLATVSGAGLWNGFDAAISHFKPGWRDKSCPSRASYIEWGVDSGAGAAGWAAWRKTGPLGRAILEPMIALGAAYAQSSYIDNCDKQKATKK